MTEQEREALDSWRSLLVHPAWKQLKEYAEGQMAARTAMLLEGCATQREEDKLRGEYMGIGLFMRYPEIMVEGLDVSVDNEQEDE